MNNPSNQVKYLVSILFLLLICKASIAQNFVHPGISNNKADLDRMKYAIKNKMDPWYSSYLLLMADTKSNFNYTVKGNPEWTYLNRENPAVNKHEYESDIQAAYANALMWYITEDTRHADKAVEIFNTWSNLQQIDGIPLGPGLYGGPLVDAAEIIRYSYDGWKEQDIKKFENMLVYPGYSSKVVPTGAYNANNSGSGSSFYWRTYYGDPARAGNQDASCWRTVMAIGVFLDNDTIYDRGYNYLMSQTRRSDDIPTAPGPSPKGDKLDSSDEHKTEYAYVGPLNQIQDYGYNGVIKNYIYENGQIQESSRDQVHSFLGTGLLANAAEIAWNQGDDMYGYLDNRILLGLEFTLKYCLSYSQSYPDQTQPWEPTQENGLYMEMDDRTGRSTAHKINPYVSNNYERWSRDEPVFMKTVEAPLAHYKGRQQAEADDYLWLERTRDYAFEKVGYEGRSGLDFNGWGALTDRRIPLCPGDPVMGFTEDGLPQYNLPELPGLIQTANFDYFVMNGGGGNGKCYFKTTNNEVVNTLRPEEDIYADFSENDKGFYLADLNSGDWYNYSISLPEDGAYDIYVHYLVDNSNTSIKIDFNGQEAFSAFTLPESVQEEADTIIWSTEKVGDAIELEGLVQSLRLHVVEGDGSLKISDLIVVREGTSSTTIEYLINQRRESFEEEDDDVGIFNPKVIRKVKVYPNPTQGTFNIELPEYQGSKSIKIDLYDLAGNGLKKIENVEMHESIDISDLPKGLYVIKVNDGKNDYTNIISKF